MFGEWEVHPVYTLIPGTRPALWRHRLAICHYPKGNEKAHSRLITHDLGQSTSAHAAHAACAEHPPRLLTRQDLSLKLLLVCRQIYHEAALKPFSKIQLNCQTSYLSPSSTQRFLESLVPTQARALQLLRLHASGLTFLTYSYVTKLGLFEKLEIAISPTILTMTSDGSDTKWTAEQIVRDLKKHTKFSNSYVMRKVRTKSLRVTCHLNREKVQLDEAGKESIEECLKRIEAGVLQYAAK